MKSLYLPYDITSLFFFPDDVTLVHGHLACTADCVALEGSSAAHGQEGFGIDFVFLFQIVNRQAGRLSHFQSSTYAKTVSGVSMHQIDQFI